MDMNNNGDQNKDLQEVVAVSIENGAYVYKYNTDLDWMYNNDDAMSIDDLLREWNCECLAPIFHSEKIDMESMRYLERSDIMNMLQSYPWGIRIKFYNMFVKWQNNNRIHTDLSGFSTFNSIKSMDSVIEGHIDQDTFKSFMELSEEGRRFLGNHPVTEKLNIESKRELCHILCGFLLNGNKRIGKAQAKVLAKGIASYYTLEDESFYFDGKKGLLYTKAVNMTSTFLARGLLQPIHDNRKRKYEEETDQPQTEGDVNFSSEEVNANLFVKNNPYETSDEFISHWKRSLRIRKNDLRSQMTLEKILELNKTYSRSDGYFFIISDYDNLNPNRFESKFLALKQNLPNAIKTVTHNQDVLKGLSALEPLNPHSQTAILLFLCHRVLFSKYGSTKNCNQRESVGDSFLKLISIIKDESEVSRKLDELRASCIKRATTMQPVILAVGTSMESIDNSFLICFDQFKFKLNSLDKAFGILCKMYFLFDLKFPLATRNVLEFVTAYVLDIKYDDLSIKSKLLLDTVVNLG